MNEEKMIVRDILGSNKKVVTSNKYIIKPSRFDKVNGVLFATVFRKTNDPAQYNRNYQVTVDWEPIKSKFVPESEVKVACSCTDFSMRWKYVLATKNGLYDGENPLTLNDTARIQAPVERNPSNKLGACKHILFTVDALLKN